MKKLFLIFLLTFFALIPIAYCDYNVSSVYQKHEFNSTKYIVASENIILNTTQGIFYLNESGSGKVYEDFTTFTEIGNVGHLSQTVTRSTFTNLDRTDDDTLTYKYLPSRDSPSFTIEFELYIDSVINSAITRRCMIFTWSQSIHDTVYHYSNNEEFFGIELRSSSSATKYYLPILEVKDGTRYYSGTTVNDLDIDTLYYVRFVRSGTALSLYVDDDSDFSSCEPNYNPKTHTLQQSYTYCNFLCVPQSIDLATSLTTTGYVQYLWFGNTTGGYADYGVLYTDDLLKNVTAKSVLIGFNGTSTTNTRVRLYTSSDNATWILQAENDGMGELEIYEDILYEYSTLYALFNISSSDGVSTPYVDELVYFYTGGGGGGTTVTAYPVAIILFVCVSLMVLAYWGLKRKW